DAEEDRGVRERGGRDDGLPSDVDTGEADGRHRPDDDQERELSVPRAERQVTSLQTTSAATASRNATSVSQARIRRRRFRRLARFSAASCAWISLTETTPVRTKGTACTSSMVCSSLTLCRDLCSCWCARFCV